MTAAPPRARTVLRVDETGLRSCQSPADAQWWELFRRAMPGRITTVETRMFGDLVDVACDDRAHADWLRDQLRQHGAPQSSLTARFNTTEETQ